MEDAVELLLMQDEQMIEALTSHTAQEALTDRIGARGLIGGFENLDVTRSSQPRETHPKFAIIIPDEILWPHAIGRGLPQLLRRPSVGGRSRHADVDHSARVQEGVEEGEERTEEQVCHGKKVAGPDLLGMGVYERPPRLSSWPCGTDLPHVLLNGALADADAQFEQFAPDPLCSEDGDCPLPSLSSRPRSPGRSLVWEKLPSICTSKRV